MRCWDSWLVLPLNLSRKLIISYLIEQAKQQNSLHKIYNIASFRDSHSPYKKQSKESSFASLNLLIENGSTQIRIIHSCKKYYIILIVPILYQFLEMSILKQTASDLSYLESSNNDQDTSIISLQRIEELNRLIQHKDMIIKCTQQTELNLRRQIESLKKICINTQECNRSLEIRCSRLENQVKNHMTQLIDKDAEIQKLQATVQMLTSQNIALKRTNLNPQISYKTSSENSQKVTYQREMQQLKREVNYTRKCRDLLEMKYKQLTSQNRQLKKSHSQITQSGLPSQIRASSVITRRKLIDIDSDQVDQDQTIKSHSCHRFMVMQLQEHLQNTREAQKASFLNLISTWSEQMIEKMQQREEIDEL